MNNATNKQFLVPTVRHLPFGFTIPTKPGHSGLTVLVYQHPDRDTHHVEAIKKILYTVSHCAVNDASLLFFALFQLVHSLK